jgi:2,3-bisphosphoglycerate-dependent phosphoglycerate mutase
MNKDEARAKFGEEQVHIWRRSYDKPPPGGESLKDTYDRAVPYFKDTVIPELEISKNVLVAAHGNSLRAIVKYLENISETDIVKLEIATGDPIIYKYSDGSYTRS